MSKYNVDDLFAIFTAGPKSRETCQEENTKTLEKESIKLSGIIARA